jgi:hypothetical protein
LKPDLDIENTSEDINIAQIGAGEELGPVDQPEKCFYELDERVNSSSME